MVRIDQATGTLRIPHDCIRQHTIGLDLVVFELVPGTVVEGIGPLEEGRCKVGFVRNQVLFKREETEYVIRGTNDEQ